MFVHQALIAAAAMLLSMAVSACAQNEAQRTAAFWICLSIGGYFMGLMFLVIASAR